MKKEVNVWHSIAEKQPEFNVNVLTCDEGRENSIDICYLDSTLVKKDKVEYSWFSDKYNEIFWGNITHWMYLPDVPSSDKN